MELGNAESAEESDGFRKVPNRLRREDAVRFEGYPPPFQDLGNERNEAVKTAFFPGNVLGPPVEAQKKEKSVFVQEPQNLLAQKTAVRGQGVLDLALSPPVLAFEMSDRFPELIEGQKGLSPVKIDIALLGQARKEEIQRLRHRRDVQFPLRSFLIAIGTSIIAAVRQNERECG